MEDLFYIVVVVVFFGLMLALVWGCDKIVGSDEEALGSIPEIDAPTDLDEVAA